jgi:hypothetical protein
MRAEWLGRLAQIAMFASAISCNEILGAGTVEGGSGAGSQDEAGFEDSDGGYEDAFSEGAGYEDASGFEDATDSSVDAYGFLTGYEDFYEGGFD